MALAVRTELVKVDESIMSSYDAKGVTGGNRDALLSLASRTVGKLTPDTAAGLLVLHKAVEEAGGDLRVTDAYRDPLVQATARAKYIYWLQEGKPKTKKQGYDPKTMKNAYVARPGRSFHNAGRAVDIHVMMLSLGTKKNLYLDKFWPMAIECGWRPIIKSPDEKAKESWHFDFMGEWAPVYDRLGYSQTALAACLDIGAMRVTVQAREKAIQAHLHRAGYDCGDIDGLIGRRSATAMSLAGISTTIRGQQYAEAVELPSSPKLLRVV